jgi:hypothetical protein
MRICHQLVVYDPVTERIAWLKDLTPEDVAALMPAIGARDTPSGCWPLTAYLEDYDADLC